MSAQCINCGVLFGPVTIALALIIWGISSRLLNWSDLKDRQVMIPVIGIAWLAISLVWMMIGFYGYEEIEYLQLFGPALIGLGITCVGVFRMRHDANFSGVDHAYAGIALFFGSLFWIYWVLEAFS